MMKRHYFADKQEMLGVLVVLLFLSVSPESLLVGTSSSRSMNMLSMYSPYLCLAVGAAGCAFRRIKSFGRKELLVSTVFTMFLFLNAVFSPGETNMNNVYFHVALIIGALFVVQWTSFERMAYLFEKLMYLLAIYSLVWFAVATFSPAIIRKLPIIENSAGTRFYSAVFANFTYYSMVDSFYLRNFGMFREPGVYQMFLNFALMVYLFRNWIWKRENILHVIIYIVAIATTTSTTGLVALAVLMCAFLVESNAERKRLKKWILAAGMAVAVFAFSGYSEKLLFAITKVFDPTYDSTISRLGSIRVNLSIFLDYPLFGIGQAEIGPRFAELLNTRLSAVHNTNTVLFMYACYGIVIGSLFIAGCCGLMRRFSKDPMTVLLLCVFIIIILSGENITNSHYAYIAMLYAFTGKEVPVREEYTSGYLCD
ncbi:O-antigen ligase family protein [Ruthenibacterium lactatiformans]|mgnify:CR=1 FL=1|uniref:O-antigen ligase-related domain-containing protein n=2 Tax=Ruthenibacterium lactatiformans TaxID=1550024 RepID=A0A6I3QWN1_9FIRM|nr:O-antigen ligase family protein [Ruthenibacterium lactatiformans]RGD20613.1 O-antigen ligase domain-containing protein [Subdoligranulum sp. AM23-21AC]MTQ81846.1 hypothetical protein [Ruthenibacterium lactatiformans]MTS16676.1 hypothetical protein [Ruthenibacterium lactatiformans]MTS20406.1 hypothetical protein [Ruthenibacterium lactatiformans]MTS20980.1 hypothetical protein [Ruthenibacterium lactatiformans]